MAVVKTIVCLANSRKLGGRCIAGKEIVGHQCAGWIRPVSARESEAVIEQEYRCRGGGNSRVLDILNIPLIEPRPKGYQQENWLLDPRQRWEKVGGVSCNNLQRFADPIAPLWINGYKTYHGYNDRIPLSMVSGLRTSLRLIWVERMTLSVFSPGAAFGDPKRRVQGRFCHDGLWYWLWVTDPVVERTYLGMPDGDYNIGECFLTISLGEPYIEKETCYKLIAAIIELQREDVP